MNKGIWLTYLVRSIDLRGIMLAGKSLPNHHMYYYHDDQPDRSCEPLNVASLKFWPGEKFLVTTFEEELFTDARWDGITKAGAKNSQSNHIRSDIQHTTSSGMHLPSSRGLRRKISSVSP
ncbi:hypothetical protein HBI77_223720 [Parastagonospora nodorum]|nr:hypothetical protein HBI77_223720 [Parastagonospora nodorum]KAH5298116.1 hypothetical protein HBI50_220690 [Parastagonospora nodorum]